SIADSHPQCARTKEKFEAEPFFVVLPHLKTASDHLHIKRLCWTVCGTNGACFSARTSAGIARAPRIQKGNPSALLDKMQRRPATERASSDDNDGWPERRDDSRKSGQTGSGSDCAMSQK